MPPRSYVNLYDPQGNLQFVLPTWSDQGNGLTYTKNVDALGSYSLALDLNDSAVGGLMSAKAQGKDWFVQVMRSDLDHGIQPYQDFIGLHRDFQEAIDQNQRGIFVSQGPDLKHFLHRAKIMYYTDADEATQDTFADDAMKFFVDQNIGPGAVSPPRLRVHIFPNIQVDDFLGQATIWSGQRANANLLDTLHEIAVAASIDFDMVMESIGMGQVAMVFKTYVPYLGNDRSYGNKAGFVPMVFAPIMNNMAVPTHSQTSANEITAMVVYGQGSASSRDFEIVLDDGSIPGDLSGAGHINDTPWNDIEDTFSDSGDGLQTSLISKAYYALAHANTKKEFTFTVLQTSDQIIGRDFDFGDNVTCVDFVTGEYVNKRITSTSCQVVAGVETYTVTCSELV